MTEFPRFDPELLCSRMAAVLADAGLAPDIATIDAQTMLDADLHEVASHGVRMLPPLLTALKDGRVNKAPVLRTLKQMGASCMLDCDNGPGRHASRHAMDEAIRRAQNFGVGICLASRTTHWGRAQAYACQAAQQGLIGLCTTNAMPTMAAWGASKRVIGNNPLAIGIPWPVDTPMVLDIAMSQAAVGKVGTWLREGHEVPDGWGLDADGKPSTDPAAILAGAVLPFGGHKGAGLALMMELLTAALAGGAFGNEIVAGDRSGIDPESSKLFVAINPEAFGGTASLRQRAAAYIDYLAREASTTAPFQWPGERGWKAWARNRQTGVPLHPEIVAQLEAAGVRMEKL